VASCPATSGRQPAHLFPGQLSGGVLLPARWQRARPARRRPSGADARTRGRLCQRSHRGGPAVFARTRIVVKGAPANQTQTFTHPFGAASIDTDGTGVGRLVNDVSPAIGNFTLALGENFGPFLKWTEGAPEGYVGNPDVVRAVTGSPFDTNYFAVTGGGLDPRTTDLTITGKIASNTGVTGDKAVVTDTDRGTYLDAFATSKSTQLEVNKGDGFECTPMANDADSDRHYARISLDGTRPSSVTVRNLSDKPVSTARISLADVTVTEASCDGAKLTVKASGPGTRTWKGSAGSTQLVPASSPCRLRRPVSESSRTPALPSATRCPSRAQRRRLPAWTP
jgi:hypothetical protein